MCAWKSQGSENTIKGGKIEESFICLVSGKASISNSNVKSKRVILTSYSFSARMCFFLKLKFNATVRSP